MYFFLQVLTGIVKKKVVKLVVLMIYLIIPITTLMRLCDLLNDIYTKENSGNDDTPMKKRQLFEYETPLKPSNDLLIFKNTQTFLSPTTKEFQRSIDKAASSAKVIYNRNELNAARKNILQSVDHILGHDLVQENPQAAAFVAELERKVQEIKEEFTKSIYSITGTMHGNEGELMFPAFQS
jgi:hypothetical protein